MQWFKLYGAELLADPKIQRLTATERSCWLTLMCIASLNDGEARNVDEKYLMSNSGVDPLSEDWGKTVGILVKFELLGMISLSNDNNGLKIIVIRGWNKRQRSGPLTGYERVKKWRENKKKAKLLLKPSNDNNDNAREEKRREDKSKYAFKKSRNPNSGEEMQHIGKYIAKDTS